jgi:hypothetical protein
MALERKMFINKDTSALNVSITAYESVGVYEMLTEGDVEELVETHPLGEGESTTWTLTVPAGGIRGFVVTKGVSFTNPAPTYLGVVLGNGKNPWPPPPPAPQLFEEVEDYEDRYEAFLMALSGTRDLGE